VMIYLRGMQTIERGMTMLNEQSIGKSMKRRGHSPV
jgi:hypothetical protein